LLAHSVSGQYHSLFHKGIERTYLIHLPAQYQGSETLPLVLALHGGFGSAQNLQQQSGLSQKSDEENFIVVYPEGIVGDRLKIRTWNAGDCCGFASRSKTDDTGFLSALIDTMLARYPIDPERIYVTGMSNGGFMAYRLACEIPGKLAAIAPVAASMSLELCSPSLPVSIIHFHSLSDRSIPFTGGTGEGISKHYNAPVDSVFRIWAALDSCMTRDTLSETDQYAIFQWSSCRSDTELQLILTRDGGHSWPGGKKGRLRADPVSVSVDATDRMWDFFARHPRKTPKKIGN